MSFRFERRGGLLLYTPFWGGPFGGKTYAIGSEFRCTADSHCRRMLSQTEVSELIYGHDFLWLSGHDSRLIHGFLDTGWSHRYDSMTSSEWLSNPYLNPSKVSSELIRRVRGFGMDPLRIFEYAIPRYQGDAPAQPPVKTPKKKPPKVFHRSWVEFLILDQDDNPVPGIKGRIDTLENKRRFGRTDQEGRIYFADVPGDQCTFTYWTSEGNQRHVAKDGDCYLSLAANYHVNPLAIWRGSRNKDLFLKRENPNVLNPGDQVHIPEAVHDGGTVQTQTCHTYRIMELSAELRLRVDLSEVTSAPAVKYDVTLESGESYFGSARTGGPNRPTTFRIPPRAKGGRLKIFLDAEAPEDAISLEIGVGHLCPVQETRGLQERLNNLGYDVGRIDGERGPKTRTCIDLFREEFNVAGNDDESLYLAVETEHGA